MAAERRILVPANDPARIELERFLREYGWVLLPYDDVRDAEAVLSKAPATAIILRTAKGEERSLELVKTVRRLLFQLCINRGVQGF